jgi:hypothetical protein
MSSEDTNKPTKPTKVTRKQRTPAETERDKELYLAAVSKLGVIMRAVDAVPGLNWSVVQNWRRMDPDFEARLRDARGQFAERLEQEAVRRATLGVEEPVFYKGHQVATVRKPSDRLLELLLKKTNPEFRDKISADVNVRGGVLIVPGVAPSIEDWSEETGAELPPPTEDGDDEGVDRG